MNGKRIGILGMILIFAIGMCAMPASAMLNPAAGYCTALGYNYTEKTGTDGSMTGYCTIAGGQTVDAWQFLYGNVSPALSYCAKQGLTIKTKLDNPDVCGMIGSRCAVCVKTDGSEQEVTAAMGLDFREKICSGSTCCDPATDKTCPIGQESSSTDWILPAIIAVIIILVIACIAYFFKRKKNAGVPEEKKP